MPTQSELSDYYASAYAGGRYTHFASAGDVRSLIASHRAQRVSELVSPGHWLDIGCSTGDFVAAALEAGARGEGIDISGPAVEQARARGLVAHHSGVEDFEPAEPFDAITAFDVVEHLLDPRDFLTRVCEWLRPGATLVLTTPDVSSLYPRLLMGRHWFYYWPDEHLFYFEPSTISCLLTEVGFVDVSVTRAHKPLTLRYSAQNLQAFNPLLGRLATRLVAVLPDGLAGRTFHISVGEMMAVARRPQ
jgi:cyclopropane fatty-acyl-phospholipid synthase-like methyltransferase